MSVESGQNGRCGITMLQLVLVAGLLSVPLAAIGGEATRFDPKTMVPLVHGPNWVDLDGDGRKDLVMKSRYNAPYPSPHSFSVYAFHMFTTEDIGIGNRDIHWHVVSFPELAPPTGKFELSTQQGMECMVRDIRLLVYPQQGAGNHVRLIQAERKIEESFSNPNFIMFTVYQLEKGNPKAPNEFSFIETGRFQSGTPYCSVTDAFEKDLGLPNPDLQSDPGTQLR